ncbi:uncharacterized protein LOC123557328 [Mercenaria mercenaria]|uniref:uncharacterized protein LOC123557328 n=1 Tax=Mercenaria mercenaria TaxID=6596 RepID=UPI00234E8052|nr:uncharacterized protein LOC123557328 [Mercenaria mercenaria]
MNDSGKTMRRRHRSLALKLTAAGFIILMLVRTDWLASVFIYSSQSSPSGWEQKHLLYGDSMHDNEKVLGDNQHRKRSKIREMMEKGDDSEMYSQACPIPHLNNRNETETKKPADCKRIQPFKSACRLAKKLFGDPSSLDIDGACKTPNAREFCSITGSPDKWIVNCDISLCENFMYLGIADFSSSKLLWKLHKTQKQLQKSVESLIDKGSTRYCFLLCRADSKHYEQGSVEPQVLNLPPASTEFQSKFDSHSRKYINLNFIFIDSVSRHHFYRSLPRSVKTIDSMAVEHKDSKLMVLDFELVQGVRSRTFENLQTLFSGLVNPFEVPFGTLEMPREKLNIEKLLVPLRGLGFSNLWMEDLCPFWEWGLSKDLLVYDESLKRKTLYKKFRDASNRAGIDDLGNTFLSCDILEANKVPDPFHAPDKICYNGKHQHEYMLSYLKTFQRTMQHRSKPFLSFFETNIGHIGSGRRIQYLDASLAKHLDFAKDMSDTLSVVFSDHGNAYGDFVNSAPDGRIEIYHPFLFMIIPEKVQSFFTDSELRALKVNQHRLISVLDLHYTLSYITELLHSEFQSKKTFESEVDDFNKQFNVSKYGLLTEISPSRTCSHMPRIMPNLCICDGYDVTSNNRAYHYILAVYFVGMMNNQIQKQKSEHYRLKNGKKNVFGGFGNCQRMKVKKIKNIQDSKQNDYMSTAKMDLYVDTDGQSVDEIFFISIQMMKDSKFSLSSFERITPYSKYSNCTDKGVDVKLCICYFQNEDASTKSAFNSDEIDNILESLLYPELKHNITSVSMHGRECLFIISQSNKLGVVYEAFNNCEKQLMLKVLFKPVNLVLSTANVIDVSMASGDITFLAAGVSDVKNDWSCDIIKVSVQL